MEIAEHVCRKLLEERECREVMVLAQEALALLKAQGGPLREPVLPWWAMPVDPLLN